MLAFTLESTERRFAFLRERDAAKFPGGRARKTGSARDSWIGSDQDLRETAPLFTTAWLLEALDRRTPQVLNGDGDEVVFHTLRFPLAPGATARRVVIGLGRLAVLRRGKAVVWNVTLDDGSVVLGNVELLEDAVVLSVSSAARAKRGHAMLAGVLAGLVAAPLTEIQTVEQMRDTPRASMDTAGPVLSPEAETRLVHEVLDR